MTKEENLHWLNKEIETWENECQSKHPIKEALYAAREALERDKPMVEIDLYSVIKQKYIKREVLDKISAEIKALSPEPTAYDVVDGNPVKDAVWETIGEVRQIIDKYRAEREVKANENEK